MLEALYVLFIIFVSILLWSTLSVDKQFVTIGNKIPGPQGLPIIGNMLTIPRTEIEALNYRRFIVKEYGHISRMWIGNKLFVFLSDPGDCEVVLKDTKNLNKSFVYTFLHPWLGTGLLTSTGEKWHSRRKAITPTFHFKILEEFISVFNRNGNTLVDCLKKQSDGNEFNIQPFISRYTLDVICESAMGTKIGAQVNYNSTYVTAVRRMCTLIADRFRKPWLHYDLLYFLSGRRWEEKKLIEVLHEHTNKVIKTKNKDVSQVLEGQTNSEEEGIKKKTAFLELLLKMKMSGNSAFQKESDIREEVNTFMFEGHDTTTAAICFTLVLLSKHKEVQEKAYKEVVASLEAENNVSYYESLQMMKYLECVIKESLRLFPSVPVIGRQITEELSLPSGYTVPTGTLLLISIYFLHRNEKYFPNAEQFNPDNFLYENSVNRHPYAYIPFSAGPRNCIGQKFAMLELKSVLSKIILNFTIGPADNNWEVMEVPNLVLQSVNGHKVKLTPRKSEKI